MGSLFYRNYFAIYNMEGQSISRAFRFPLSHLPTFFLTIGYPVYWLELYVFRLGQGRTTPLAWIIVSIFTCFVFFQNIPLIKNGFRSFLVWFSQKRLFVKLLLVFMTVAGGIILLCAFYASLLPPHLVQEFDALNYHITLPRQHLLRGSFGHIPWSTADLYFLPVDFALAPFWLATSLPNKLPQFFFLLGLLGICNRLARRFSGGKIWPSVLLIFAVLGSHNIGIQMGTAMLDVAICYLFLAALDSFLSGAIWLAVIELNFYIWSKPLISVQFLATLVVFSLAWLLLRSFGVKRKTWVFSQKSIKVSVCDFKRSFIKGLGLFIIFSLFLAGPFVYKSLRYSGTPIFPLGVGVFKDLSIPQSPQRGLELKSKAAELLAVKDNYGSGRSLLEFARHLWLIAVPEKGVNNRYDYPLGLMYLLFAGPFLFLFFSSLKNKVLPLLPLWVIASWGIWWFSSQQTRFLFIPVILIYLVVVLSIRVPSRILLTVMLGAILLVSASVYRANKPDLGKWGEAVLRSQDKELISLGKSRPAASIAAFSSCDLAYAAFPVKVSGNDTLFVLNTPAGYD